MSKAAIGASEPLVSVIVPVYNRETVLKTCLDSLATQTLTDIEIIVVNDASTDGSGKIMEGYAATDSRFRVLENSENQNSFETRRRGFAAARGAYIATCDSDDFMPSGALEQLYETAQKTKADIVHGRMDQLIGKRLWRLHWVSPFKVSTGRSFVESLLRFSRAWNVCGKLYHQSVIEKALTELPVNKRLFLADDLLFSFFFGLKAGRYVGSPETVYCYRFNKGNHFSQPEKWPLYIADHFDVLAIMRTRLEKKDLPAEYDPLLKGLIKKTVREVFQNLPAGADFALARSLITERLGKSYLMDIYGQGFSLSPFGDDFEPAGKTVKSSGIFPASICRRILFILIQLWRAGGYEATILFRHMLILIRRNGWKYALEKLWHKSLFS